MKKKLIKIMLIIVTMIIEYQPFVFADGVDIEEINITMTSFLIGLPCVAILVISALLFLVLKGVEKIGKNDEKYTKNKKILGLLVYVCSMISSLALVISEVYTRKVLALWIIPAVAFIVSIVFRIAQKIKLSNIICIIAIIFICITVPVFRANYYANQRNNISSQNYSIAVKEYNDLFGEYLGIIRGNSVRPLLDTIRNYIIANKDIYYLDTAGIYVHFYENDLEEITISKESQQYDIQQINNLKSKILVNYNYKVEMHVNENLGCEITIKKID